MPEQRIRYRLRGDTAVNWTVNNPVLLRDEPGVEEDTGLLKLGDGVTAWVGLPYFGGSGDADAVAADLAALEAAIPDDYVGTRGGGGESVVAVTGGTAATLDLSLGNVFVVQDPAAGATCTLTIIGAEAGRSCGCTVVFHQPASGNSELAFAGLVTGMNNGGLPGPVQEANAVSEYSLRSLDGGAHWQAWKVGDSGTPAAAPGLVSAKSYVYANNGLTQVVPANAYTNFLTIIDTIDTNGGELFEFDLVNHRYHILKDCLIQFYGDLFWPDISSDPAATVYFQVAGPTFPKSWNAFVRAWDYENLPKYGYRFQTPVLPFTANDTITMKIYKSSAGMTVNYAEVWATAFTG